MSFAPAMLSALAQARVDAFTYGAIQAGVGFALCSRGWPDMATLRKANPELSGPLNMDAHDEQLMWAHINTAIPAVVQADGHRWRAVPSAMQNNCADVLDVVAAIDSTLS